MAHPLGALLGQYVPPVGGVPFEGPGGVTLEAFGCPAVGLDLWHFFFLTPPFLNRVIVPPCACGARLEEFFFVANERELTQMS